MNFIPNDPDDWKTDYPDDLVEPEFTMVHIFADDVYVIMKSLVISINAGDGIFDGACGPQMRRAWNWLEDVAKGHKIGRPDGWYAIDKQIPECPSICSCGHLESDHRDGKCTREDGDCDCPFFLREYPE